MLNSLGISSLRSIEIENIRSLMWNAFFKKETREKLKEIYLPPQVIMCEGFGNTFYWPPAGAHLRWARKPKDNLLILPLASWDSDLRVRLEFLYPQTPLCADQLSFGVDGFEHRLPVVRSTDSGNETVYFAEAIIPRRALPSLEHYSRVTLGLSAIGPDAMDSGSLEYGLFAMKSLQFRRP